MATGPARDTPDRLRSSGEAHGLDPVDRAFLAARPGDPEDTARRSSEAHDDIFTPRQDDQRMRGAVLHLIDQGGRLAAELHGLGFEPVNVVPCIDGPTGIPREEAADAGRWESLTGLLDWRHR